MTSLAAQKISSKLVGLVLDLVRAVQSDAISPSRARPVVAPDALLPALSPQSVLSPPYAPDARAGFYGFGIGVSITSGGRVRFSHSGVFTLGAGDHYALLPSEDIGIVVLRTRPGWRG